MRTRLPDAFLDAQHTFDMRRVEWRNGDTLKVLDWEMRYFGRYTLQTLEDTQARTRRAPM